MASGGQMSGVLSGRLPAASLLGGAVAVWRNMKSSAVKSCVAKETPSWLLGRLMLRLFVSTTPEALGWCLQTALAQTSNACSMVGVQCCVKYNGQQD